MAKGPALGRASLQGCRGKILLRDDQGVSTTLARMAPGGEIPHHEHTGLEQTCVIEGGFEDHDGVCGGGEYVWRLAGNRHVARSRNGCPMLVFFESSTSIRRATWKT